MLDRRVGCLPVVEDEVLVGIITTSDILASRAHQPRRSPGPRSLSVADAMTRAPQTARPEDSLREAIHRMSRAGIRHLPVVDDRFHVLGILSDRDIRNVVGDVAEADQAEEPNAEIAFQLQVAEVMTAPALTVNQAENLREVMGDLIDQRVGAFAVTDHEDHLVGILSYVDVLTALYHQG
jgi:acetoin utilization protein AcuB